MQSGDADAKLYCQAVNDVLAARGVDVVFGLVGGGEIIASRAAQAVAH